MKKSDLFPSTYYNSSDVRDGAIALTIDNVKKEPVGEGANKTEKPVAHFKENGSKLLVLSPTKFDAIALIAKSDETKDWPGTRIALEASKAMFQGKLVDAVAIRAPNRKVAPKKAALAGADENDLNDEVPF